MRIRMMLPCRSGWWARSWHRFSAKVWRFRFRDFGKYFTTWNHSHHVSSCMSPRQSAPSTHHTSSSSSSSPIVPEIRARRESKVCSKIIITSYLLWWSWYCGNTYELRGNDGDVTFSVTFSRCPFGAACVGVFVHLPKILPARCPKNPGMVSFVNLLQMTCDDMEVWWMCLEFEMGHCAIVFVVWLKVKELDGSRLTFYICL